MTKAEEEAKRASEAIMDLYYNRPPGDNRPLSVIIQEEIGQFNDEMAADINKNIINELQNFTKSVPSVTPTYVDLSDALYSNGRGAGAAVAHLMADDFYDKAAAKTLARTIYDGYNSTNAEIVDVYKDLPNYVKDFIKDPGLWEEEFTDAVGDISNRSYQIALEDIEKALLDQDEEALAKAMNVALEEKARYYADRIAQTEVQRAKNFSQGRDILQDGNIEYVQWELSSHHKIYDICDYYARLDLGFGPGIYPKNSYPSIPLHPHCMCKVTPHYRKVKKRKVNDPTKELFKKLTPWQQKSIAGSWDKLNDYYAGTPLIKVFNDARPKYPIIPLSKAIKDLKPKSLLPPPIELEGTPGKAPKGAPTIPAGAAPGAPKVIKLPLNKDTGINDLNPPPAAKATAPKDGPPLFNADTLPEHQQDTLTKWTQSDYLDIRLDYYDNHLTPKSQALEDILDAYSPDAAPPKAYRGINFEKTDDYMSELFAQLDNMEEGDIFKDVAPSSWTDSANAALSFAQRDNTDLNSVILRVVDNTKPLGYDIRTVSKFKDEAEILVAPGTKFKVIEKSYTEKGNATILTLEIL